MKMEKYAILTFKYGNTYPTSTVGECCVHKNQLSFNSLLNNKYDNN